MDRRDFLLAAAAAPFALRTDLARARLSPLALVTCDTQARIAAVDPLSGRTVRSISVPVAPNSIELAGGNAEAGAVPAGGSKGAHTERDRAEEDAAFHWGAHVETPAPTMIDV